MKIDARVSGYEGQAIRVIALTMVDSGKTLIRELANWHEAVIPTDDVVVVTDSPQVFHHWSIAFDEKRHTKEVMQTYLEMKRSHLLQINDGVKMYDPREVLQFSKMDERGQILEFDTRITNGHMAVLLAIWGAKLAYAGFLITQKVDLPIQEEDVDLMLPFSV